MKKPTLYTQEKMDEGLLPAAKEEKRGYDSFKEFFEDPKVSNQRKLNIVGQFTRFVTLNGLTKQDLHAALKWLFDQGYEFVDVFEQPAPPKLELLKGEAHEKEND